MLQLGVQQFNVVCTLAEFTEFENQSDVPLEFIDGYIYAKSFSSMKHNKIVTRINSKIDNYLLDKPCQVFSEQIEVILGSDRVKPDVFVVCRNNNIKIQVLGQSLLTVPTLIFEVVSPSNARLDTVTKMDLYAKSGIPEYNLVYQEGEIHQYKLNEFGVYYLNHSYKNMDTYNSVVLDNLEFDLNDIFINLDLP